MKNTTKATKNRITALLLSLLLVTTILSPQIPVKAQETTVESADISENNSSGGTSAGAGDKLPTDVDENGERTITISQSVYIVPSDGSANYGYDYDFTAKGKGKFVIVGYYNSLSPDDKLDFASFLLSNESFTLNEIVTSSGSDKDKPNVSTFNKNSSSYNGVSFAYLGGMSSGYTNAEAYTSGFMNERQTDYNIFLDALKADIDRGNIDLSKDDYISEDQIANMTPVQDESIGYLPRARYFDDRKKHTVLGNVQHSKVTSTIQWASFEEPYVSDLDNPYYVEIYADLNLALTDSISLKTISLNVRHHYKKYGELKYVWERLEFPYANIFSDYLSSSGSKYDINDILYSNTYVSAYYVRLLHYDYEKQQVLCGGWTKLIPNDNGGCTSETGDFPNDTPSDDDFVSGDDDPKEWDDTGWEPNPNPDDPDNPDFGIDTSSIGAFFVSAITSFLNAFKSILSLVGEFPDLLKHIFSFLPDEVNYLMFCGVGAILVMRFLGR